MACKAVLFDLDGTLLDTLDDIAEAANAALASMGFPTHDRDAYRRFVGDGASVLMERALPPSARRPETVEACVAAYIAAYDQSDSERTRPYAGIVDLLDDLVRNGVRVGVVTNKQADLARSCMDRFFPTVPFGAVVGQEPGVPRKPSPEGALRAAGALHVPAGACWFLGDTAVDIACAINAGMTAVGVRWGFRSEDELRDAGANVILARPADLLTAPGFADPAAGAGPDA